MPYLDSGLKERMRASRKIATPYPLGSRAVGLPPYGERWGGVLLQLQVGIGGIDNPLANVEACAAIVYAGFQHVRTMQDPAIRPILIPAAQRAIDAFTLEAGFAGRDPATGEARPISPNGQALLAAALSRLLNRGYEPDRLSPQLVRSAMDKAWQSVPDHQHVMLLPWLGWSQCSRTIRPLTWIFPDSTSSLLMP